MQKLRVFKNGKLLGVLQLDGSGLKIVSKDKDELEELIEDVGEVSQYKCVTDADEGKHIVFESDVAPSDPAFSEPFISWAAGRGYKIIRGRPELDEKIKKLLDLSDIPEENKEALLKELPNMSHLDKTTILEMIKTG